MKNVCFMSGNPNDLPLSEIRKKNYDNGYEQGVIDVLEWLRGGCFDERFADVLGCDIGDVNSVFDKYFSTFEYAAQKIINDISMR